MLKHTRLITGLTISGTALISQAAVLLTTTYTQDFDTLQSTPNVDANGAGAPTWTNDSTLTGWYGGGSQPLAPAYGVGNGSDNTMLAASTTAVGSFGATGNSDRALAPLKRNTTANIALVLQNTNASPIVQLNIAYTGEQWRDNAAQTAGSVGLDFSYQVGATDIGTGTWTAVAAGKFDAPQTTSSGTLDGNLPANRGAVGFSITGLNLLPNEVIWLRWQQRTTGNNGSYSAVDDLSVTAVVPEPTAAALLGIGALLMGRRRRT